MKRHLCILAALVAAASCSPKVYPSVEETHIVNVRDSVAIRDSLVLVPVPDGYGSAVLPDTDTSRVETQLASSEAWVSGGTLYHTIRNKATERLPVVITVPENFRFVENRNTRTETVVKTVEVKKPLTWWQKFQMAGFWVVLVLLLWKCRHIIMRVLQTLNL